MLGYHNTRLFNESPRQSGISLTGIEHMFRFFSGKMHPVLRCVLEVITSSVAFPLTEELKKRLGR